MELINCLGICAAFAVSDDGQEPVYITVINKQCNIMVRKTSAPLCKRKKTGPEGPVLL